MFFIEICVVMVVKLRFAFKPGSIELMGKDGF